MNMERFSVLKGAWAVVRLGATDPVPPWALHGEQFLSITRTTDELSVVCLESVAPRDLRAERGWAILKLHGPFPFNEVGVLASFAMPLAAAKVTMLAFGTFDTDYILVKSIDLATACRALTEAGHEHVQVGDPQ